jgi:hypothetical protein
MLSMKKWFSGKSSKQEFDIEARQIVTENFGNHSSTPSRNCTSLIQPLNLSQNPFSPAAQRVPPLYHHQMQQLFVHRLRGFGQANQQPYGGG